MNPWAPASLVNISNIRAIISFNSAFTQIYVYKNSYIDIESSLDFVMVLDFWFQFGFH